jgi:hypothetical protein
MVPLTERRQQALAKLNRFHEARGEEPFIEVHQCGKHCDHTEAEPCVRVRNWERGELGLDAAAVEEIAPEVVHLGPDGKPDGVHIFGVLTMAVTALQELAAKVDTQAATITALQTRLTELEGAH